MDAAHDPAGTFVAGTMLRAVIVLSDNVCVGLPTHATGVTARSVINCRSGRQVSACWFSQGSFQLDLLLGKASALTARSTSSGSGGGGSDALS